MSWVKIDDKAWSHPKMAGLNGGAVRLWLFALCWVGEHGTDGHVPRVVLRILGGTQRDVRDLMSAGLWDATEDGWEIHDYLVYQPSAAEARSKRQARAEAGRSGGLRSGASRREANPKQLLREQRSKPEAIASHLVGSRFEQNEANPNPEPEPEPEPEPHTTPKPPSAKGAERQLRRATHGDMAIPGPEPATDELSVARLAPRATDGQRPPARRSGPTNLDEALKVPVAQRALGVLEHPDSWRWCQPHQWPELQAVGAAFARACGWHVPRWTSPDSTAVKRIVALLAEFSKSDLERAIDAAKTSSWLRGKGLSALSDEVVRRLLSESSEPKTAEDIVAERRSQQRAKELGLA